MAFGNARLERQHVVNSKAQPCAGEIIRSTRGTAACPKQDKAWVLAAAVLGSTMAFVNESVANVALPKIEADLRTTLTAMQWVINAYTLCMSALLMIGGAALAHQADEDRGTHGAQAPRVDPQLVPRQGSDLQRCRRGHEQQGQTDHEKILWLQVP